ncbi:hypothetical protein CPC08DRAFT_768955 [Agrocybe pediades]|nr:hypothetical protein CPC08DRAFT_768955 [Agrocybe pediades]
MSDTYPRYNLLGFDFESDFEEPDAQSSSPGHFPMPSSPDLPRIDEFVGQGIPFNLLPDFSEEDNDDLNYDHLPATPTRKRSAPLTDDEKTIVTLKFMASRFSRFGLRKMLSSRIVGVEYEFSLSVRRRFGGQLGVSNIVGHEKRIR